MNACTTPIYRKRLVDPAACGVRLGVDLRAAAERHAYRSGMCLSHWIKSVVEVAVRSADTKETNDPKVQIDKFQKQEPDAETKELNDAFAKEMEKLDDR